MKKNLSKIKSNLVTLWIALLLFSSKVFGTEWGLQEPDYTAQTLYGVPNPKPSPETIILVTIKILQRLLVSVVLVLGIINLIKIKKIDDKQQKKEKIKKTIITIAIVLMVILLLSVVAYRLSIM